MSGGYYPGFACFIELAFAVNHAGGDILRGYYLLQSFRHKAGCLAPANNKDSTPGETIVVATDGESLADSVVAHHRFHDVWGQNPGDSGFNDIQSLFS